MHSLPSHPHTPSLWPPNVATSSLSESKRHPARAANHSSQIKTVSRLELDVLSDAQMSLAACIMSANIWNVYNPCLRTLASLEWVMWKNAWNILSFFSFYHVMWITASTLMGHLLCSKLSTRSGCHFCLLLFSQKYKEPEKSVRVEEIDGVKLVKNLAVKMEEMFQRKAEATRVCKKKRCQRKQFLFCFYYRAEKSVENQTWSQGCPQKVRGRLRGTCAFQKGRYSIGTK